MPILWVLYFSFLAAFVIAFYFDFYFGKVLFQLLLLPLKSLKSWILVIAVFVMLVFGSIYNLKQTSWVGIAYLLHLAALEQLPPPLLTHAV